MKQMLEILNGVYNNPELRKSIVPLFIGNPGIGKTKIIEQFAKEKGVHLLEMIASQVSPFEVSGVSIPSHDLQKMIYYNYDKLDNLKDNDILFFDEIFNANPTVLNACLTILESRRMISGKPLLNIMIVAAANPQGQCPLTPQIKERFVFYDCKFDSVMWKNFMKDKYGVPFDITNKIVPLIKAETFTTNNFITPRSVDKAFEMILSNVPTPYEKDLLVIMKTMIKNENTESIIIKDKEIGPNELFNWLEIAKLLKN